MIVFPHGHGSQNHVEHQCTHIARVQHLRCVIVLCLILLFLSVVQQCLLLLCTSRLDGCSLLLFLKTCFYFHCLTFLIFKCAPFVVQLIEKLHAQQLDSSILCGLACEHPTGCQLVMSGATTNHFRSPSQTHELLFGIILNVCSGVRCSIPACAPSENASCMDSCRN